MKLRPVLSLLLAHIASVSIAQTPDKYVNYIPPSPNAATFQLYGDYPVSYSTGLPAIEIPLFKIALNQFSLPVDISYHASGRKTNLSFSTLGMGWSMQSIPVISRTVKGRADMLPFQKAPYPIDDVANLSLNYDKVLSMTSTYAFATAQTPDSQHDLFNYTLNGKSGKFVMHEGNAVLLSGEPIQIRALSENYFEAIDDNGVKYLFGTQPGDDYGGREYFENEGAIHNDSWFVNTITTPLGEELKFKYGNIYSETGGNSKVWGNMSVTDVYEAEDAIYNLGKVTQMNSQRSFQEFFMNYLKEIRSPNGKIQFNYDSTLKLTSAVQTDIKNNQIRRYNFGYLQIPGESLPNNNSILLASLSVVNSLGVVKEKHTFDYNLDGGYRADYDFPKQRDWWGYYNGFSTSNVPDFEVPLTTGFTEKIGSAQAMRPSFAHKSYGILRKISYPTGGSTQFIYESNRYLEQDSILKEGPGVRVQQMISFDGYGVAKRRLYKYGENENGAGKLLYQPRKYDFASMQTNVLIPDAGEVVPVGNGGLLGASRVRRYKSIPNPEAAESYSFPVYYSKVTEYEVDSNLNAINGKTEYAFSLPRLDLNQRPLPAWGQLDRNFVYMPVFLPTYQQAQMLSKKVYQSRNNSFELISSEENKFATFKEVTIPEIFLAQYIYMIPDDISKTSERRYAQSPYNAPVYVYRSVVIKGGASLKTETTSTEYAGGISRSSTMRYSYNNLQHLYPTIISTTNSKGENIETHTSYPSDYNGVTASDPASAGLRQLLNQHVLSAVIESSIFRSNGDGTNRKLIKSSLTGYKPIKALQDKIYAIENTDPLGDFQPAFVQGGGLQIDARYKTQLQFNRYDSTGHLLEQEVPGNYKQSYFWGYNSTYPVAKVTGTDYQTAARLIDSTVLIDPPSDNVLRMETNKLRVGLPQAIVNTFSYTPLVGMTSQTDERGVSTYYSYDDVGRMISMADNNQHILKYFDYNLTNNSVVAPNIPVYQSSFVSLPYKRNDCAPGMEGTQVYYEVPAGLFTSTISAMDAQAQAEAASAKYGQIYANAKGTCRVPVVMNSVKLWFNVTGVTPTQSITVKFMQASDVVLSASFPRSPSGPFTFDLPVGTYYLTVDIPSIYKDMNLRLSISETGQSWNSDGAIGINTDAVNMNTKGVYNITISN